MANLHLVTGYAGAAHVAAADQGSLHVALFGGGSYVLNRGNKFAVSVVNNNTVRLLDGDILMQGRHIRLNENTYVDVTIENGEQGLFRNDLIVCRYTKDSETGVEEASLVVIKGAATSGTATDPEYTEADIVADSVMVADMPLYRIPIDGLNVGMPVCLFDTFDTLPESFAAVDEHINDGDVHTTVNYYTASVPVSWSADGTNGGYKQTITVSGILATDNPIYDVVLGDDTAANELYLDAFSLVARLTTANGSITLWTNGDAPTTAFSIKMVVMR